MSLLSSPDVWGDVCPYARRVLSDEHRKILTEQSGIDPEIIEQRGYHTVSRAQIIELIGLEVLSEHALQATGWLAIPILRPDGVKHGEIIRLFGHAGTFKYLWPRGERLAFDVHPSAREQLVNSGVDVLLTEGIKKADALLSAARREGYVCAVIAVNGCDGWKTKAGEGSVASPDFLDIPWSGRRVFVISDSDYRTNDAVARGWNSCTHYVEGKTGEHKAFLVVVPQEGKEKVGADDYLAAGHTLDQLLGHAQSLRHAASHHPDARTPLRVKTGRQLMKEAGDKIPHLIMPLLPEQSIMLMAGHTGTFKTWTALGLALDGAFGLTWTDHPVLEMSGGPFSTLYVNKEMSGMILGQRLKMMARDRRYTDVPDWEDIIEQRVIFTDEAALDLNVADQRARLEDAIMTTGARLVVLDSLSMSWHGDENSSTEVGAFYTALRDITERTRVAWLLIHHLLKPQSGRQKENPVFSVRGSGQLMQQADAAVLLAHYQGEGTAEPIEEKLLVASHVKARTSIEMPAWLFRFSTNDGLYASLRYLCLLADAKARSYAKSSSDPDKLRDWLFAEFLAMPGMVPTGSGMRFKSLVTLLQQNWTVEGKEPPSEATIRRQLQVMIDTGELIRVEQSKRHGDLLRLAEPEEIQPEEPHE